LENVLERELDDWHSNEEQCVLRSMTDLKKEAIKMGNWKLLLDVFQHAGMNKHWLIQAQI
jgi:hypothetical protein